MVTSRTTEAKLTSVINLIRHAGLSRYWVLPPQLNSKDEDCSSRIQFLLWFQSLPVGGTCRKCEISVVKWILDYSELMGLAGAFVRYRIFFRCAKFTECPGRSPTWYYSCSRWFICAGAFLFSFFLSFIYLLIYLYLLIYFVPPTQE